MVIGELSTLRRRLPMRPSGTTPLLRGGAYRRSPRTVSPVAAPGIGLAAHVA
jgi:hypothetical protein